MFFALLCLPLLLQNLLPQQFLSPLLQLPSPLSLRLGIAHPLADDGDAADDAVGLPIRDAIVSWVRSLWGTKLVDG